MRSDYAIPEAFHIATPAPHHFHKISLTFAITGLEQLWLPTSVVQSFGASRLLDRITTEDTELALLTLRPNSTLSIRAHPQ